MSKALVVGGSNGIGLSLVCNLIQKGYSKIYILDKEEPDVSSINLPLKQDFEQIIVFKQVNLVNENLDVLNTINDIDTLILTIGFGRVSLFENLTEREIKNLLKVNFDIIVRIIKHYYYKIKSNIDFFTAIMVSISGRVVSPLFSVYGATKAGLRFFIENINCELIESACRNRILEVSPGSISGTRFSGKENNLILLNDLSNEIIKKMLNKEMLFIPQFDDIYNNVINEYNSNSLVFGKKSYEHKKKNGRIDDKEQVVVGFLSGTFDLFHIGHLNLLKRAKEQCDYLIVSVHESGAWKGKETFIPYNERVEIVKSIKYVDEVVEDFLDDSKAWEKYHYNKLFVGSDYKGSDRFNLYEKLLKGKASIIYFPYTKGISSTQLRNKL